MLNNYAETSGGFNNNHGQTTRPTDNQKQQNIGSSWNYNSQLEGMYYSSDHQPMFVAPYEGSTKHSNYSQYPSGTIHQPVPTPVVKCHEACCQHYQDRYPLNPAPLRYQPSGPVQPRYADLANSDSRQYFTDRRPMQPSLSRKKMYPTENGYGGIPDRHYPQFMGRGQLHMADSRQQMMRSQYPMYPYWGSARGWTGPRMNCPPPPSYHQSVNQGAQLQAGLKMTDGTHYMDPSPQKSLSSQHRRGVGTGSGGPEIIRPVPESKRTSLDPNLQSCYEFGYPTGFVPFSEVNKIQGGSLASQNNNSTCKIPSEKQYHPHQMQYSMQSNDRNLMNCSNPINDLSYPMNFPLPNNDSYIRPGMEDGQQISDARKIPLQYDSSLSKKRPDLDLRQYLATWEDDEDENTRLSEPLALGNSGAPYIVVDCRSLEGEAATKLQERFKTPSSQACSSKSRSSSPNTERKRSSEQSRQDENSERANLHSEFQTQTNYAPSMPNLLSDSDKNMNFWNGTSREGESIIGKGGAFQPLDCSKRDGNLDPNAVPKRDSHPSSDLSAHKMPITNESANMSFDALVSYYGDNRRMVDGGYDFVEMTERLVNNSDKPSSTIRTSLDHQIPNEISRPCDPRLQQSQLGNNPSIYNKMAPRYPTNSYQHFKPSMGADPYHNYKHPMNTNKYFGYDSSQIIDPNYEYHKIASEFDSARLYGNKELQKDPRRMFHQEVDKTVESAFLDSMQKAQITDCFRDKSNLEFNAVDPEQFISPIVIKKSESDNRDKTFSDKTSSIRERMEVINNENQINSDKTVLITSQNGPPEIFRVPYSPDKELSHKDNVVTLHSGDQTKGNAITVEVPYVQQYSTLVKLTEEISRTETSGGDTKNKDTDVVSAGKLSNEEFKKPTSFKLKRLPNSKEWTVEGKEYNETNGGSLSENVITDETLSSSCEITEGSCEMRDTLKSSVTVSNLNMPSLDDIRDVDENCQDENHSKNKLNDSSMSLNKTSTMCDEVSKSKYTTQVPQMAIVQPMKLNQSESKSDSNLSSTLSDENCEEKQKSLSSTNLQNSIQTNFDNDKIDTDSDPHMELMAGSDISKHENFRTHKKIQSSFSNSLPNCLSSPNQDFLHSQDVNSGGSKESYSPFHVYSDCDMNPQIADYFKLDERNQTDEKILDTRMPSSPGVEGMFEDINHSNQNQLYQSKTCNFQDLTDPNMTSLNSHSAHFQSFSSIFSDEAEKNGRSDGSVLQMNDKKYLKHIFDDIENQQIAKSLEEREDELESNVIQENSICDKSDEAKRSPPIPPISLKLNETKKIWCIAKKDQLSDQSNSPKSTSVNVLETTEIQDSIQETFGMRDTLELRNQLAQALQEETEDSLTRKTNKENYHSKINPSKNDFKNCERIQNESILNDCIFSEVNNKTPDTAVQRNTLVDTVVIQHSDSALNKPTLKMDYTETKEGHLSLQNIENKCLSMITYCPKIGILKHFRSLNNSLTAEVLVFDEKGTHYPKQRDKGKKSISESKTIALDILEFIITKTVAYTENREKRRLADIVPSERNNSCNKCEISTPNVDDSIIVVVNTGTVIKFDSSSNPHLKETKEHEHCIAKTTEIFIQHEKENYQHYSVIKTLQSEDNPCTLNEKKKTSRSIFSPMSEGSLEDEDACIFNNRDSMSNVSFQDEGISNLDSLKTISVEHMDCLDIEGMHNINGSQTLDNIPLQEKASSEENFPFHRAAVEQSKTVQDIADNTPVIKHVDDEEFKGFGSPKTILDKQESDHNISSNFEIDEALELMGLSSVQHLEEGDEKNRSEVSPDISGDVFINEKSSVSLQQSLEDKVEFEERLDKKDNNHGISHEKVSFEDSNKSYSVSNFSETVDTRHKENVDLEENIVHTCRELDFTSALEHSSTPATLTNVCGVQENECSAVADIVMNEKSHCLSNTLESQCRELNSSNNDSTFSVGNIYVDDSLKEVQSEIKDISENISREVSCLPQSIFKELCSVEETSSAETSSEFVTSTASCESEKTCLINSNSLQGSENVKVIAHVEDFEARLETSVIVRNSSCNNIKYSEFSESCKSVECEKPALSSTSKQFSSTEVYEPTSGLESVNANTQCLGDDAETPLFYSDSHKSIVVSVGDLESCCSSFVEDERKSQTDTFHQSYNPITDCDLDVSLRSPVRCPVDSCETVGVETVTQEIGGNHFTENKPSVINQTSVVTSKDLGSANNPLSPETISKSHEEHCYCVGESVFLHLNEETKTSLKKSKLSYFHEFKKRKWQKFVTPSNKSNVSFRNDLNVQGVNSERDYTIINFFNTSSEWHEERLTTEANEFSSVSNNVQFFVDTKANETAHPPKTLERRLKDDGGMQMVYSDCDISDSEETSQFEDEHESMRPIIPECMYESMAEEKATVSVKDFPVPLKDKSCFFTSKETNNFCIKRDSFKILEPEAVLREIFSPDPEIGDSESKENECPENLSQEKHDNSSHNTDAISVTCHSNVILIAPPNVSSKPNKWNDFSLCSPDSVKSKGLDQIQNQDEKSLPTCDSSFNKNKPEQRTNLDNPTTSFCQDPAAFDTSIEETEKDNMSVPNGVIDTSKQTTDEDQTLVLCEESVAHNNPIQTSNEDVASLSPCYSNETNNSRQIQKQDISALPSYSEFTDDTVKVSESSLLDCNILNCSSQKADQGEETVPSSVNIDVIKDTHKSTVQLQGTDTTKLLSCEDASVECCPIKITDQNLEDDSLTQNDTIVVLSCQDSDDNNSLLQTTDNFIKTLSSNQNSDVNGGFVPNTQQDKQTTLINGQDSIVVNGGSTKELDQEDIVVSNEDTESVVLLSTEHFQSVVNLAVNIKDDNAKSSGEENKNVVECKNEKIDSVQDSLRKSQHLNNDETFPLQCLVEAALALENVDSKRMLLNNSSFSGLFSQPNESSIKSSTNKTLSNCFDCSDTGNLPTNNNKKPIPEEKRCNVLTPADREIFSKFEETNYNLRASTRIVTSSSSNIIPYSKRRYVLKSTKLLSTQSEDKQKKSEIAVSEKSRTKKRRGCFTYPRSKRKKKVNKEKQKCQKVTVQQHCPSDNNDNSGNDKAVHDDVKESILNGQLSADDKFDSEDVISSAAVVKCTPLNLVPITKDSKLEVDKSTDIFVDHELEDRMSEEDKQTNLYLNPEPKDSSLEVHKSANLHIDPNPEESSSVVDKSTNLHTDSELEDSSTEIDKYTNLHIDPEIEDSNSKTGFGGPLIIASENSSSQGNVFCVHVNSDKMDEYVNNLNLGELEILSGNDQTVFKENPVYASSDVSNVTLENGASLVIIIEELNGTDKKLCDDASKGESDFILGSVGDSVSCLPQSHSILDDCSDILTTDFSVNESCICPPEFETNKNSEIELLKQKPDEVLENEHFISKSTYEMDYNIGDSYEKYSVRCNQDLLTANCYEEINENLVNDIGNWPFVEEEVAEFESKVDPNNIPEEGRKIELKCSLPWKKIFNMSKNKKKKSTTQRKVSGLELGPAKVEVRLKAPSAEWKVISDYHANSSPVVKVRRLILQRDSDVSSYSEKDSEEEVENKRCSSDDSESSDRNLESNDHAFSKSVSGDENWQPVVLLTRNKKLDELTLSLDSKLLPETGSPIYNSHCSFNAEDKNEYDSSPESFSESELSEILNEDEQPADLLNSSYSTESSVSSKNSENKPVMDSSEDSVNKYRSYRSGKADRVHVYETYSPSGCNDLRNEIIYSPSDPHFSPEAGYGDSDSRSSCGDTVGKNVLSNNEDDEFNASGDSTQTNPEPNDKNEKGNELEETHSLNNTNSLCHLEENHKVTDVQEILGNILNGSQNIDPSDRYLSDRYSPTEVHTITSIDTTVDSVEGNEREDIPQLGVQETISKSSKPCKLSSENLLSLPDVVVNKLTTTNLSTEINSKQQQKLKRKMPKNFFVRKKLRKHNLFSDSTDEKSLFGQESDLHGSEDVSLSLSPNFGPKSRMLADRSKEDKKVNPHNLGTSLSGTRSRNSSVNVEPMNNSESDSSLVCENSRLQCVYDLEDSSPVRRNDSPLTERFEVKQRLRNGGRGLKRPCEGHSKEDTKRRRKKLRRGSSRCQECDMEFQNKEELCRHNAYRHARRRELHHCLLCQRSFSSAVRHSLHVQGRSHRHLELTQRHTMHAMHHLLVGGQFPLIPSLSRAELRALQWRPAQPGYVHFYHDLTPLQTALQEPNSDVSEDTLSEGLTPND